MILTSIYRQNLYLLFSAMEVITTELFPRLLPSQAPSTNTLTVVGQLTHLDSGSRKFTLQTNDSGTHHLTSDQTTFEVKMPESMECAELRNIQFIEVRGYIESDSSITLKEYTNLRDNFGTYEFTQISVLTTKSWSWRLTPQWDTCLTTDPKMIMFDVIMHTYIQ